ncbi:MAG TPA: glycosyltransferase [Acidimicrobiales bacterium]|nr:glycosyltransferase [Acidimicrobiales bacterium]
MVSVVVDIQGAQSVDHRDRGIARYVTDLARGLAETAPHAVEAFSFNPDLPLPGGIEPLVASGKLRPCDEVAFDADTILHVASPVELAVPFGRVLPPRARAAGTAVVATLFDLIPEVFADRYLVQPGIRRRYRTRLELLRSADRLLSISAASAADAERLLGVDTSRIDVIPLAASDRFVAATDRAAAKDAAARLVPGLRPPFVLYTGGQDFRKNMERLVAAWGLLDGALRREHQLVLTCALDEPTAAHYRAEAERLGFAGGLVVTGFVTDDVLVLLNQAADLVAFPAIYEGFGLPVVEALACGTPVVGANHSSVPELLPREALFDPMDPPSIARAIERGLTDADLRHVIVARHERRRFADVVSDTLASYERLGQRPLTRRRAPRRCRVALCTPLPPVPGGVSDFSARLLESLPEHLHVEVFVDGPPHHRAEVLAACSSGEIVARPLAALEGVEAAAGPYDAVVWTLGNSEYHTGALDGLLRRGGIALAHEVRLTNLYRFARWQHPATTPGGFQATLHRMYPGLPPGLGAGGLLDPTDAERWGVLMARDAVAAASRFLVTSPFAAELARVDARREHRDRIQPVPFAMGAVAGEPWERRGEEADDPLVVSFGGISALKQTSLLIAAFAAAVADDTRARLAFVGPINDEIRGSIEASAQDHRVTGRIVCTGEVDGATYRRWLSQAWLAVQLRASTNGESSGAVGDCLVAGVPTIVTRIGAARSLVPSAAVGVPPDVSPEGLAVEIRRLLRDDSERARLSRAAIDHARGCTYPLAAEALAAAVVEASARA